MKAKDKPTQLEKLSQQWQTKNNKYKITVTFLTGFSISNVTSKCIIFNFISVTEGVEFNAISKPPCVYEMENLKKELKRENISKDTLQKKIIRLQSNQISQQ